MNGRLVTEVPLPGRCSDCYIGGRRFRIATVGPEDMPEMLRLFAEVFGHAPDEHWFDWKYGAGQGEAVGLWDESGRQVAHYAGLPRTLCWRQERLATVQIIDVMVAPAVRGLLPRKGAFFQVCSSFFDSRVGKDRAYRLAFGFPNQRHLRLGVALDLYRDVRPIHLLRWDVPQKSLPLWWDWSPLPTGNVVAAQRVAEAWKAMSQDMGEYVLGLRNMDYLRWRFLERPDRQYQLFCLRRRLTGRTEAVAVMRFSGDQAELLDVVGPRKAFGVVLQAAADYAAQNGAMALTAWASSAVAEVIGASGTATILETGASLAIALASEFSSDDCARARWWWMGGDTDFL